MKGQPSFKARSQQPVNIFNERLKDYQVFGEAPAREEIESVMKRT